MLKRTQRRTFCI